jgi:hypothetical protein
VLGQRLEGGPGLEQSGDLVRRQALHFVRQGSIVAGSAAGVICYLARVVGSEPALGTDPELPQEDQQLLACQWFALELVRDHPEVALILPALRQLAG